MAIKPSFDIQWATDNVTNGTSGNPNKLEPFEFKSEGQQEGLPVPRQYLNFQFDAIRQWKDYLEETTDNLLATSDASLLKSNNLSDLTNVPTARNNLGLTTVATSLFSDTPTATSGVSDTVVMSPARTTDHFNNRTTSLTRVILGRSDSAAIRSDLGLGSAALLASTSIVQTTGNQTIAGVKTFSSTITGNISGNSLTATRLQNVRNIALTGDVTGSANFDGSNNISIVATVADNSHNHTIANISGLQTALDGKPSTTGSGASGTWAINISGTAAFANSATSATNAGTVTNGVYTTGNQTIAGTKTFTSQVLAPSFRVSSDPQLKDKLVEHKPVNGVDKIKLMQWVWKQHDNVPEHLHGKEDSGVDASVVKEIFPNCVGEDSNGFLVVDYAKLAVHLILAKGE